MSAIILTREELYAEVWTSPLTKLAKKYGLSDRGLAKVCARMEIPVPGVGYWAKAGAGHEVKQTPLPPLSSKGVASVELRVDLPAAPMEIMTPVDGEHPLVEQTRRALQGRKVSPQVPYLTNHEVSHLSVRVTPAYLERALGLMNTLLHALEDRGHTITLIKTGAAPLTRVSVDQDQVSFILQERLGTSAENGSYLRTVPTGELELSIDYRGGIRKSWKDLKKEKLEVLLGGFIASITAIQEEKRNQREERESWQRQYEKKKQEEQEIAKRKAQEKTFFRKVELQAECWQRAESIRSYLDAIEEAIATNKVEVKDKAQMDLWLATSRDLADRLDPIAGEWTNEPPQFAERESRNAYMPSYEPPVPNHPPYWVMKQRWKNR